MNTLYRYLTAVLITAMMLPLAVFAGNKDRSGQAGASELLINPWTRSSGWASANMARVRGLEAMWGNVAGTAFTGRTQLIFSNVQWLKGTGTNLFAFGLTQKVGDDGALGIQVMSMNFGEIEVTTTESPDGGLGTFSPSLMNFSLSYAKAFSHSIYGGMLVKVISESISDVSAFGIAIDAGIQYVTGEQDQLAFGVSLKNIGPQMQFSGDGLSLKSVIPGQDNQFTLEQRSDAFEIPTQLNIGASYDFLFPKDYRLTVAGTFISNSFTKDQFSLGLEGSLHNWVLLRMGYTYEQGMWDDILSPENTNVNSGFSAGFSVQVPLNKEKGTYLGIDYAYRQTVSFSGNHYIGIIFNL